MTRNWLYFPASAAAAFTPANLPGAQHWWDSELSPKTLVGSDVSQLNDLIGSLHLSQSTINSRPDNLVTINGLMALDFDGFDSLGASAAPSFSTAFHIFTILKFDVIADDDIIVDTGPATHLTTNDGMCLAQQTTGGSGGLTIYVCDGVARANPLLHAPAGSIGITTPHLVECWSVGTTAYGINVDGVSAVTGTPSVQCQGSDSLTIMGRTVASTLNGTDGQWGMTVVCAQQITGADLTAMRAYCTSRWGVP